MALADLRCLLAILLGVALVVLLRWWTNYRFAETCIVRMASPPVRLAIVFGAGVWPGGQLSPVLEDRVYTAVRLYNAGKVRKLLMTGDNRTLDYNEPQHMREYALELGVPDEDIVLDYAGRRTYDCMLSGAAHLWRRRSDPGDPGLPPGPGAVHGERTGHRRSGCEC